MLGAGAGDAPIVLLHQGQHDSTRVGWSSSAASSSSSTTATLPPATLQIIDAINKPATGGLPAGWTTFMHRATGAERAGFTIAAPANWTSSTSGHQTYLRDPSLNANILIDLTPHTYPGNMLAEAEYIKSQSLAQGHFPGYSQLGLATTPIRGTGGSYWKFTWLDNGVQQEVIDLLFGARASPGRQTSAPTLT